MSACNDSNFPFELAFLHGLFGTCREFLPYKAQWSNVASECYELLNHGGRPSVTFSNQQLVSDLEEQLRAHKHYPLLFVGHSLGGVLACHYTQRYPQRVAAIVLLDAVPSVTVALSTFQSEVLQILDCIASSTTIVEVRASCQQNTYGRYLWKQFQRYDFSAIQQRVAAFQPWIRDELATLYTPEVLQLAIPILIILGTESLLTRDISAADIQTFAPHAEVVRLDGAGHMPHITHRKEVMASIQTFFSRNLSNT